MYTLSVSTMKQALSDKRNRNFFTAVAAFALLFIFLLVTSPKNLALALLLVPFSLLFIGLYNLFILVLDVTTSERLNYRYRRGIAIVLAIEPVLLLLLASIDQLSFRDGLLSLVFVTGVAWYLARVS